MTRDELAESLKATFGPIVREADEWRPLADYVLAILRDRDVLGDAEKAALAMRDHLRDGIIEARFLIANARPTGFATLEPDRTKWVERVAAWFDAWGRL